MTTFDATCDFEADGVLEAELQRAADLACGPEYRKGLLLALLPADETQEARLYTADEHCEVANADIYATGFNIAELARNLRAAI